MNAVWWKQFGVRFADLPSLIRDEWRYRAPIDAARNEQGFDPFELLRVEIYLARMRTDFGAS